MTEEIDLKLKAFGSFKTGSSAREVSEELEIPYAKALKWKKQLSEAEEDGEVANLVEADAVLIHRVAEEVKEELVALGADANAIEGELQKAGDKIEAYKILNEKLNLTAVRLADRINSMAGTVSETGELKDLVDALSSLQTSFFAKGTNVAVFPGQSGGESGFSIFQSGRRD